MGFARCSKSMGFTRIAWRGLMQQVVCSYVHVILWTLYKYYALTYHVIKEISVFVTRYNIYVNHTIYVVCLNMYEMKFGHINTSLSNSGTEI